MRASLVQAVFHRADRDAQLSGHLGMSHPLPVKQQSRLTLARRKPGHRFPHQRRDLHSFVGVLRTVPAVQVSQVIGQYQPTALLQAPTRQVQRDPAQPGAEPSRAAQPRQTQIRQQRGFLHHLRSQAAITQHPPSQRPGQGCVTLDQPAKGLLITPTRSVDQHGVLRPSPTGNAAHTQ